MSNLLSIPSIIIFEANSFIGRKLIRRTPKPTRYKLLNLGCSTITFDGWVNADFYPNFFRKKFWKHFTEKRIEWYLDLRFKLHAKTNFFEGVFTEHTLEHLSYQEVSNLLSELYIIMKPGSIIRIIVPNLAKYIELYNGNLPDDKFLKFDNPCTAISCLTQNYGHRSLWDFSQMKNYLEGKGFVSVKKLAFREGEDDRLLKDQEDRKWESLYVEAKKPF